MEQVGIDQGPNRIPSLDGFRALAISMVIIAHSYINFSPANDIERYAGMVVFNGRLGVAIFFVISGFIITKTLNEELECNDSINLYNFYLRRIIRLFPAYYVFLFIVYTGHYLGFVPLRAPDIIGTLLFYSNNLNNWQSWWVGHIWSLNVEEQFYAIYPCLLLFLRKKGITVLATGIFFLNPIIRLTYHAMYPRLPIFHGFFFSLDYLMIGSLVGLYFNDKSFRENIEYAFRFKFHILAATIVFTIFPILSGLNGVDADWFNSFLYLEGTINAPCIALFIIWCVLNPRTLVGKILNQRYVVWIGTLSYSIYLWQQPFMPKGGLGRLGEFPINLIPIGFMALLSHYLLERPFVQARARLRTGKGRPGATREVPLRRLAGS